MSSFTPPPIVFTKVRLAQPHARVRTAFSTALAALIAAPAAPALAQNEGVEQIVVTGTYIRRPSQFDFAVAARDRDQRRSRSDRCQRDRRRDRGPDDQYRLAKQPGRVHAELHDGTSNVNLRGLGVSSTLVLLNGRRQTQSAAATDRGENFVDTSSLPPMIAFDRLELLKDGATALYGSEAVAGVVNFITRSEFEGFDLELSLQSVDDHPQDDSEISGLYGVGDDRTHLLAAFSYLDRDPLTTYDRRLSSPTDDLSQAGNPGSFLVPSLPGNPAFQSVWTSAFDTNRNGVADFVEPTLGRPPVPGAQPPVFADQDCVAIAAQDPKVVPSIAGQRSEPDRRHSNRPLRVRLWRLLFPRAGGEPR